MKTPQWDMMNGIVAYLQSSLRADTDLRSAFGVGTDGQKILQTVYPCRVFDATDNGLAMYMTDLPVMGIYPTSEESMPVDTEDGMEMTFGVQYALKGQPGDPRSMGDDTGWPAFAKMQYILEFVWWKVRDYLQNPASLLSSYRIEYVYLDSVTYHPPLQDGTFAMECSGTMAYPLAPWTTVTAGEPFVAHDGDIIDQSLGTEASEKYTIEATETAHPWKEE